MEHIDALRLNPVEVGLITMLVVQTLLAVFWNNVSFSDEKGFELSSFIIGAVVGFIGVAFVWALSHDFQDNGVSIISGLVLGIGVVLIHSAPMA